ncbi:MAG: FKBP-type peptidyl-prolyl cis-trans isomerase [Bacteroidia bacterium]|nr:FKBP-type peptidyl-prolyl cis-trans isomerase [Bacteroidia bacterium]MCX7652554.1 FKBP-type peptidyl-prolyl cis-trans isomerase [Bacteroidia bacterium]MDW8417570.1 FKBP-type peptidyl-prolyl cis-trans isomerase [Bacteroidia bacterium]
MRVLPGCTVSLRYTLSDENGQLLYQTEDPLEFTVGEGEVLPAFEEAILEMEVGETKTFTLSPEEAYGPYMNEWVFQLSRQQIAGDAGEGIQPGQLLTLHTPEGEELYAYVIEVDENSIRIDANHPLAGKSLTYSVEILSVE